MERAWSLTNGEGRLIHYSYAPQHPPAFNNKGRLVRPLLGLFSTALSIL
jgi:hypothetical protein